MTTRQIKEELTSATGGSPFASIHQLSKALRIDSRTFLRLMEGAHCWRDGKAKRYLIADVAARIAANRERVTG